MSVIHLKKRKEPFVQLHRDTIQKSGMTLKALGLWSFCVSRDENWVFYIEELSSYLKASKNTIYKLLNEMIDKNLCHRFQYNFFLDENDKIRPGKGNIEYIISAEPMTEEEKKEWEMGLRKNQMDTFFLAGKRYCVEKKHEEFKKSFLLTNFQHAGFLRAEKRTLKTKEPCKDERRERNDDDCSQFQEKKKPPEGLEGTGISQDEIRFLMKSYSPEKIEKGLNLLKTQKRVIENPIGWLTSCLQRNWEEKKTNRDAQAKHEAKDNHLLAIHLEEKANPKLKSNSKIIAQRQSILINRGMKNIEILYTDLQFKEKLKKELKIMQVEECLKNVKR